MESSLKEDENMSENINALPAGVSAKEALKRAEQSDAILDRNISENQADASEDALAALFKGNTTTGDNIPSKRLSERKPKDEIRAERIADVEESVLVRKEDAEGFAQDFSGKNPNYLLDITLLIKLVQSLGLGINEETSPQEIIAAIRQEMTVGGKSPSPAVVDKVFEFLLETTQTQMKRSTIEADKASLGAIYKKIEVAKGQYFEQYAKEIQAGHNIIEPIHAAIKGTDENISVTLDQYVNIVHNPVDLPTLRKGFETMNYETMVNHVKKLSRYFREDFQRNDMENPELMQLMRAVKQLQAIIGVYRQSQTQIPVLDSYLELTGVLATAA
jgi:hypothetical protein